MYRNTRKRQRQLAICAKMREGKQNKREERARELGPRPATCIPPELRRVVIVIDYDHGGKVDIFRMTRTHRIDSYQVWHNQSQITGVLGWSNFCKRISTHYPRMLSPYA